MIILCTRERVRNQGELMQKIRFTGANSPTTEKQTHRSDGVLFASSCNSSYRLVKCVIIRHP